MKDVKSKFILSLCVFLLLGGIFSVRAGRLGKTAELTGPQQAILEKLPAEDRQDYERIRYMFQESKRGKSFSDNFNVLEIFINRRPENVMERSYLVGYFPLDGCTFISNLRHLQSVLGRCKSSLSGGLSRLGYNTKFSIEHFKYCKREEAAFIRSMPDWRQWIIRKRDPGIMMVNIAFQPIFLFQTTSINFVVQQNSDNVKPDTMGDGEIKLDQFDIGNPGTVENSQQGSGGGAADSIHNDSGVKLEKYKLDDRANMINFEISKYGQLNMQQEFTKKNDESRNAVDDSNCGQTVVDFPVPNSPSSEALPDVRSSGV